jgi:hypothetical protein
MTDDDNQSVSTNSSEDTDDFFGGEEEEQGVSLRDLLKPDVQPVEDSESESESESDESDDGVPVEYEDFYSQFRIGENIVVNQTENEGEAIQYENEDEYNLVEYEREGSTRGSFNVFLDLDNTLLCAVSSEEKESMTEKEKENYAVRMERLVHHNMEDYYDIFERPGLQEFLDWLFANFNVNVWSAASKDYVAFIVENIILNPEHHEPRTPRSLDYVFFSYHCSLSKKFCNKGLKNLGMIWDVFKIPGFTSENTVIIDDLDKVLQMQDLQTSCACLLLGRLLNLYEAYDRQFYVEGPLKALLALQLLQQHA